MEYSVNRNLIRYPEEENPNEHIQLEDDCIVVIMPDGPGSKGDEAIARGLCRVLSGEKFVVFTPGIVPWEWGVPDLSDRFISYCMPVGEMHKHLNRKIRLVIAGTDGMDGTCGVAQSLSMLEAARAVLSAGGSVKVFCSFRSDVNAAILEKIKELQGDIRFYLREEESIENFTHQTGLEGRYFPDFAYYCERLSTDRAAAVVNEVRKRKNEKNGLSIAINFGEHSFQSLTKESTFDTRSQYVINVLEIVSQIWPDANLYLLPHDKREWVNHWSDASFCRLAYDLGKSRGYNVHLIAEDLAHAEILTVLPEMDLVISSRMHLSIAAIRSGVLPIVYTGINKAARYNISDKVSGMLKSRLGYSELRVSSNDELKQILTKIARNGVNMYALAWENAKAKEQDDQTHYFNLRKQLKLPKEYRERECREAELMLELAQKAEAERKIIRKEYELRRIADGEEIERLNQELNQVGAWGQKMDKELQETSKAFQAAREELDKELQETSKAFQAAREELDRIRNSHSWKIMQPVWKLRDIVVPYGSRRRKLLKLAAKVVRHPKRAIKAINRQRLKKLLTGIKNGDFLILEEQFTKVMGGTDIQVSPVSVLEHVVSERMEDYEKFSLPAVNEPLVSIIIPVYNQFNYTYLCIKSIVMNSGDVPYEIIIADDCSTDLTKRISEIISGVRVVKTEKNLRFLLNCNNAAKYTHGKYILLLNNDTQVQKDWLCPLVDLIERDEKAGMVGSKLIYPNGLLQEAGGILWKNGSAWNYGNRQDPSLPQYNYVKEADYISGAAIMIRKDLWQQLGGFDERFAPAYCEDSDLAFMVREAGYKVLYQPQSVVVHFEGVSNGTDTSSGLKAYQVKNQKKFYEKWKHVLDTHNENAVNVFNARDKSIGRKTVLFVDHYVPTYDKDAGSRTVFAYLKMFVEQGFNVKFIGDNFYQSEPYTTTLQQMGVEVLYGSWYAQNWKQWIKENADCFDYAFLNRPHISVNYIDFLRENTKAKIIYYGHDLHFLRVMREYELTGEKRLIAESESWKEKELSLMRKADISYYPSEVEEQAVHAIDPSIRVKAIPAYLFDDVQDAEYDAQMRKDLFFIGGFGHGPNVDAVKWLAKEVMPLLREKLPQIQIHIVGSNMPKEIRDLEGNGLVMEGAVSDERLAELYAQCRLNIVPLRYGAGIKGKVVESMRFGLPVVTTSCGAEGIMNAQDCLVVADTAQELVESITLLYENEEKLNAISKAGVAYVRAHYSQANAIQVLNDEFGFTDK